jgi:hypothetical protein
MVTGRWSADGRRWLLLRESDYAPDQLNAPAELAAFDTLSGEVQLLQTNLAAQWLVEVLTVHSFGSSPEHPASLQAGEAGILLAMMNEDGTQSVELMDANGVERTLIAQNVTVKAVTQTWSADYRYVKTLVTWSDGTTATTSSASEVSTWVNSDGSIIGTFDLGVFTPTVWHWTDDDLYYSGFDGDHVNVGTVNAVMGQQYTLFEVTFAFDSLLIFPSPAGDGVLIDAFPLDDSTLHLADRQGRWAKKIEGVGNYYSSMWSPDSAEFAYIGVHGNQILTLVRAAADGTPQVRRPFLNSLQAVPRFLSWTPCSMAIPDKR